MEAIRDGSVTNFLTCLKHFLTPLYREGTASYTFHLGRITGAVQTAADETATLSLLTDFAVVVTVLEREALVIALEAGPTTFDFHAREADSSETQMYAMDHRLVAFFNKFKFFDYIPTPSLRLFIANECITNTEMQLVNTKAALRRATIANVIAILAVVISPFANAWCSKRLADTSTQGIKDSIRVRNEQSWAIPPDRTPPANK